jgi:DNA-binding XRE family transcriptional regulator
VIKAIRVDSNPLPDSLSKTLTTYLLRNKMPKSILAAKLGVSLGTLKNWECCRTKPNIQFWSKIRELMTAPVENIAKKPLKVTGV